MIQILPSAAKGGETLSSAPVAGLLAGSFSLASVKAGQVYFNPVQLGEAGSSHEVTIPLQISDPGGNVISTSVRVNVVYTYCPSVASTLPLNTNGTSIAITSLNIPLVESHGLSVWDIEWVRPTVAHGILEFYCPDSRCGSKGWLALLSTTTKFTHVFISNLGMDCY
jgi:hypothetical protein